MGDHRADVKITLTFPDGVVHKWDAWLNYWPDDNDGVDPRVKQFFREAWEKWLASYYDLCAESNRAEQERLERRQLEALKKKYEGGASEPNDTRTHPNTVSAQDIAP